MIITNCNWYVGCYAKHHLPLVADAQTLVVDRPGLFLWIYIFDMNSIMKIRKIMSIPESSGDLSCNKGFLGLLKKLPSARKFWPYRSLEGATARVPFYCTRRMRNR